MDTPLASVFWAEGRPAVSASASAPARVDIAIIGGGYTGLACALRLARGGASVAVLEAEAFGRGASSRNGGMAGPSFHKLGMAGLTARYGEGKALAIMQEGLHALDHFERFIAAEGIDCAWAPTGRLRCALTEADHAGMLREAEKLERLLGLPCTPVARADQRAEIGSDHFRGGVVYHRDGLIQPRLLLEGLAAKAAEAGAALVAPCPVARLERLSTGWRVHHAGGATEAAEVVSTVGAFSSAAVGPLHARVVPILTAAAATEALPEGMVQALTPKGRGFGESARVFMWFRPTPCGRRFVFGGRIGPMKGDFAARAAAVKARAVQVFPELAPYAMSHAWTGVVGYTQDHAPHLGRIDGIWHAGGYCGSGVTRSLYFGDKLARRIAGETGAETAFDDLPFPKLPFRPLAGLGAQIVTAWHARADAKALAARGA